jgi:hypothetical protein
VKAGESLTLVHHLNKDPVYGCQIKTKYPILHANQDQLRPIGFSDGQCMALNGSTRWTTDAVVVAKVDDRPFQVSVLSGFTQQVVNGKAQASGRKIARPVTALSSWRP